MTGNGSVATIDFYFDLISPFVYLARGRLVGIAASHGADIVCHPVNITQLRLNAGNTGPSNSAIPAKLTYFMKDYRRWADYYDLPIVERLAGYETGVFNKGALLARARGEALDYIEHASACIWRDGLDPGSAETYAMIEARMGWGAGELGRFAASDEAEAQYEAETTGASARGVFGVPTFIVGEEMWWGNDRLDFLERYLSA